MTTRVTALYRTPAVQRRHPSLHPRTPALVAWTVARQHNSNIWPSTVLSVFGFKPIGSDVDPRVARAPASGRPLLLLSVHSYTGRSRARAPPGREVLRSRGPIPEVAVEGLWQPSPEPKVTSSYKTAAEMAGLATAIGAPVMSGLGLRRSGSGGSGRLLAIRRRALNHRHARPAAAASACPQDSGSAADRPQPGFYRYLQQAKAANARQLTGSPADAGGLERHRELRAKLREMSAEEHGVLDSHVASLLASSPPSPSAGDT